MNQLDQVLDRYEARLPGGQLQLTSAQALEVAANQASFHGQTSRTGRHLELGGVAVDVQYDRQTLNDGPVVVSLSTNPNDLHALADTALISEDSIIIRQSNGEMVIDPQQREGKITDFINALHNVMGMAA